jgi:hypothetical protein
VQSVGREATEAADTNATMTTLCYNQINKNIEFVRQKQRQY